MFKVTITKDIKIINNSVMSYIIYLWNQKNNDYLIVKDILKIEYLVYKEYKRLFNKDLFKSNMLVNRKGIYFKESYQLLYNILGFKDYYNLDEYNSMFLGEVKGNRLNDDKLTVALISAFNLLRNSNMYDEDFKYYISKGKTKVYFNDL